MRKRGKKGLADRTVDKAVDLAESVIPTIETVVESVTDKAGPILSDGREMARERSRRARRRAAAKAAAFTEAAPKGKVSALVHAEPASESKGGTMKKLLLVGVLVAIGGAVAKRLRGGSQGNWQSTYTPTPAASPTPKHAAAAPAPDDQAAATPGEALADRADEPHPDTTPDDPAEVVELADVPDAEGQETPEPVGEAGDQPTAKD